ncbi:MAG: GAF domain-containing protein [Bacteroidota bacterium]
MIYNGKEIEFPAVVQTSFFKVIERLEKLEESDDSNEKEWARHLLHEVALYPELKTGMANEKLLNQYKPTIDKLSRLLFPEVLTTNEIKVLTPPFTFNPLRTSARFDSIVKASGNTFEFAMKDVDEEMFYLWGCYSILTSYYGYPMSGGVSQLMEIYNKEQNITRSYKILINADLSEFVPTENAIEITKEDFYHLLDNLDDMSLWKHKFPPNSWVMRGIMLISLVDVTTDQSLAAISSDLLNKTTETFDNVKTNLKNLINNSEVATGVIMVENGQMLRVDKEGMESIILDQSEAFEFETIFCETSYETLINNKEPLVITDVTSFHKISNSIFSKNLLKSGVKSYIIIPLVIEEELLGFIELGAMKPYELHKGSLEMLNEVIPVIAMANKRFLTEKENLIEAIIQKECTTIHPSVKWKFEEEAFNYIKQQYCGEQPIFKDIVFKDLYPLYGQMDIKGSSERRNKAVSSDLIKQIKAVRNVLVYTNKKKSMPAIEELIYRLDSLKGEIGKDLIAGSEHKLLTFLETDVYPAFNHLIKKDPSIKERVEQYYKLLDPELKTVYEERKSFDQSVNQINHQLATYLDQKQIEAQQMFPHYFERYKTDGVEFNMYIGQSITKNENFDRLYLKNLRLWQLAVMCEMENEFKQMQSQFDTKIEIASLILVYNSPISVHFRMDEKQFDVEGAYNARYEIIKKRIDKAFIKGTKERVTTPGKIAIVYSQDQDAIEYKGYLKFLAAKGYIKDDIEDVALEDLQGVHGLRALRVPVVYSGLNNVDSIIKAIEEGVIS